MKEAVEFEFYDSEDSLSKYGAVHLGGAETAIDEDDGQFLHAKAF